MSDGIIGFSSAGDPNEPSPSIWGDCPNTLLRDKGMGYFAHEEFLGNTQIASFADQSIFGSGVLNVDCDTAVLTAKTGVVGGYASVTSAATDNNSAALIGQPLGTITRNTGQKFWFEVRAELGSLADAGVFIGLTTEANANRDVVADNPSNAAAAALTAATVIGFVSVQAASAIASFNAVYAKGTGTPVTVVTNVTNSTNLTAAGGTAAPLAALTEYKFGLYYNGRDRLIFFLNGFQIAQVDVDATVDQTSTLVPVVVVKTGAAAAFTLTSDFVRYAFQTRT